MTVGGTWEISMSTPLGDRKFVLACKEEEGGLTGTLQGTVAPRDIFDGKVEGDKVTWKAKLEQPMRLTASFSSVVNGDDMAGKVKFGMFHNAEFVGKRVAA
ncbi:MAG: hypothetical protein R3C60_02415 [Parvularculaceae bacterium]